MLTATQLCIELRIDKDVLELWMAEGWLLPVIEEGTPRYSDVDIARGRLIRELGEDFGVNAEGTGIILDLLDQLYGLRLALRRASAVPPARPEPVVRRVSR
jgi:chaperone modulatory protein CbpM